MLVWDNLKEEATFASIILIITHRKHGYHAAPPFALWIGLRMIIVIYVYCSLHD
jgi:hypothetical protein